MAVFGWIYGIALVTYFVGLFVSAWRLRRFADIGVGSLHWAAILALIAGWPTSLRTQNRLISGERAPESLVTPRNRPALIVFFVALVPFYIISVGMIGNDDDFKTFAALPFAAVGLLSALVFSLRD